MIMTTGLEPCEETLCRARELAKRFGLAVVPRKDLSLKELRRRHGDEEVLVVSALGARLEAPGKKPFFFHPNTSTFRIKRLVRGDTETMLAACQIQPGDRVPDATMDWGPTRSCLPMPQVKTGASLALNLSPSWPFWQKMDCSTGLPTILLSNRR